MRLALGRRLHVSWCIAVLAAGFLMGVAASALWHITSPDLILTLPLAGLLIVAALRRRNIGYLIVMVTAGSLLGLWRGSLEQAAIQDYRPYYGQVLELHGRVTEDTAFGKQGDQRLQLADVTIDGQPLPGKVWVSTQSKAAIKRSDFVTVRGKLGEGFGNMPASLARADVVRVERPQPGDVALEVRDWFSDGIRQAVPEPQASLGAGFLTGQRSSLPPELDEQLKVAGLTHIVVASGYNLTILVGFARRAFLKASKYLATLAAVVMVVAFVMVTGLSPSMTRAGLVTLLALAAWYYGRTVHPLVLLPLAAAITVAVNPAFLWGDMGWYLSFGSFAGVLLLAPLIHRYFWGDGEPGMFRQILIETSSAQLATLPIILYAFSQYSAYSLLANMVILPLIPLTMLLTFVAGIAGVTIPAIASWIGLPANAILHYMTAAVEWVANLPGAQGAMSFSVYALIISYAAMTAALLYMWRRTGYRFRSDVILGEKA